MFSPRTHRIPKKAEGNQFFYVDIVYQWYTVVHTMKTKKTKPVPVRLDGETIRRLERAANRMGSNNSSVIRFAIIQVLPDIERGTIVLNN